MPIFVCFHPWTRKQLLGMVRWLLSDLAHEDIGLNPNGPPLNLNIHSFHIVLNVTCALSRSGSLLSTQWRCRLRQSTCVFLPQLLLPLLPLLPLLLFLLFGDGTDPMHGFDSPLASEPQTMIRRGTLKKKLLRHELKVCESNMLGQVKSIIFLVLISITK